MKVTILGGGLAGISLAYELQKREEIEKITIIEKEETLGGLCRSYDLNGVKYDAGPHIIFSKDQEVLELMKKLLEGNIHQTRRSNRIIHKGILVQYPFENDLSKLPLKDKELAVNAFVHNPYENYEPKNMLQFFLKTFGEGITNLYLRPYNEKIWKFDPSFMNTKMVDRIPKPPKEDILRSANGETVDGYLHQLYFNYPDEGATFSLIQSYLDKLTDKVSIITGCNIKEIEKNDNEYVVKYNEEEIESDRIVSTIPICELVDLVKDEDQNIQKVAKDLRYNSIMIITIQVSKDLAGDNFAFMVADKDVIFHRISKIDFLGEKYHKNNTVTYMAEITYREKDINDIKTDEEIVDSVVQGLKKINFIDEETSIIDSDIIRFKYAYVVYDLNHQQNMDVLRKHYNKKNIYLHGRFGDFEYLNMDQVIRKSIDLGKDFK